MEDQRSSTKSNKFDTFKHRKFIQTSDFRYQQEDFTLKRSRVVSRDSAKMAAADSFEQQSGNLMSSKAKKNNEEELSTGSSSTSCSTSFGGKARHCSLVLPTLSEEDAKVSDDVRKVLDDIIYEIVNENEILSRGLDAFGFNSRSNRILSKMMTRFEHFVDDSLLGKLQTTPDGKGVHSYGFSEAVFAKNLVQACLRQIWPNCQLETYGSLSTGLWLPGQSDMDLLLNFNKFCVPEGSMLKYFPPISPPPAPSQQQSSHSFRGPLSSSGSHPAPGMMRMERISSTPGDMGHLNDVVYNNAYFSCWTQLMNQLYIQNEDLQYGNFHREDLLMILDQCQRVLSAQSWCQDVKLIPSGMPVVKLSVTHRGAHGRTGPFEIPVDISVMTNEHTGLQARDFVSMVIGVCPGVFRPLVLVLKQLLRENGLNDVYTGGLGSYSLCLLVVFFLKRCGYDIPTDDDTSSVGSADSEDSLEDAKVYQKKHSIPKKMSKKANFHKPPNPYPNYYGSSNHERIPQLISTQLPPVCHARHTDEDYGLPEEVKLAGVKVEDACFPARYLLARPRTDGVNDSEVLGCLLFGVLKLFSLPSDGGMNLGEIGLSLEGCGKIFLHKKPVGLAIRDPVTRDHIVGAGSFNMYKVQALFSHFQKVLADEPQKLFFCMRWSPAVAAARSPVKENRIKNDPPAEKPSIPLPPIEAVVPKEHEVNEEPRKEIEPKIVQQKEEDVAPTRKSKFAVDIDQMNKRLQEAHQNRSLRIMKNYERFMSETSSRKKILGNKPHFFTKSIASQNKQRSFSDESGTGSEEDLVENKCESPTDLLELDSKKSSEESSEAENNETNPDLGEGSSSGGKADVDFWEEQQLQQQLNSLVAMQSISSSFEARQSQDNRIQTHLAPFSPVPAASWANVVKSPCSQGSPISTTSVPPLSGVPLRRDERKYSPDAGFRYKKNKNRVDKLNQKPSDCLFVGNLSYYATDGDIEKLKQQFSKFGQITGFSSNKKKGVVWIKFSQLASAKEALIGLDQRSFLNRPLYVDFSQMPSHHGNHSFGSRRTYNER